MLLRGEMAWRARVCAVVLGVAVLSIGLAPNAPASDVRHFEKVSPADKGNGDIIGDGGTNIASRVGDAVTLSTRTPFGDTIGSGVSGQTQYIARRTSDGWAAHAITPAPRPETYQTFFGPTVFVSYSDDLRTAVVWGYDFPSVTGDLPLHVNVYAEDTATRSLEPVTALQSSGLPNPLPDPLSDLSDPTNWGVSADARHVAFVSRAQYLPEAVPGNRNLYKWDDGVLSLASVLPNGAAAVNADVQVGPQVPTVYRAAMSADGSRLAFSAAISGRRQLFLHIDGARTAWVSESELDPSDPNFTTSPVGVRLRAMTPDGRGVFFVTSSPLVSQDTNSGLDLYRWTDSPNPSSDSNLTLITQDGGMSNGLVVGVSDDGQRVYYQTLADQVSVWDHDTTHVAAQGAGIGPFASEGLAVDDWGPGVGRVTPDGRYLAFASKSPGITGDTTNGFREMYLYDLTSDTIRCVSCPSGPATSSATVAPDVTGGVPSYVIPGIRPRFLSDDGKVFFSTGEALLAQDRNGVLDVYEYDPVTDNLTLVSTGKGSDPATFTDASASGGDVFIVTRQRLVASDHDGLVDMYDARIGDALPSPPEQPATPICEGETCQPPPSASPPEDLLGSLVFDDGGSSVSPTLDARHRLVLHGASGSLRVELGAPGTLRWSGRGLRSGSVGRSRSGAVALRLRLGRHARARLKASGTYTTSVHLVLASSAGDATRTTRVVFKTAAKKGR